MADSLYLSLWFADFSTDSMFARALAVMREFPFSQQLPGIRGLALHPVSWNESTVLEERFGPSTNSINGAQPEEAIAIASGLVHEDHAYVFEAGWDLWNPREGVAEWVLEPSLVKFIIRGEEFEEGEAKTQGDIQIDFGLDSPFLHEELQLSNEVETRVRANVQVLVDFVNRVEKNAGSSARLLWSESDENLAQKLVSRLQRVQ
jgi:hypothetical protein